MDIQTARQSGLDSISVSWGFKSRDFGKKWCIRNRRYTRRINSNAFLMEVESEQIELRRTL